MAHHIHSDKPFFDLIIAEKSLSSWSLRAWLVAVQSGLPFKEVNILFADPKFRQKLDEISPTGKLPVLRNGKMLIWDSLAIAEYLNELSPEAKLWPEDIGARALARSYASEVHSGFSVLRSALPFNLKLESNPVYLTQAVRTDIRRILDMWTTALKASEGPYLFGDFSIADAFFAPIVLRLMIHKIDIKDKNVKAYMKNILGHHGVQFWLEEAKKEKLVKQPF